MKSLISFAFVIAILIPFDSNAKAEKNSNCEPREPAIEYIQAITIAKKAQAKYFSSEGSLYDLVKLNCKNQKHIWVIGFRRKAYESGYLLIYVYIDGATKTSVVKVG